jgi:hypothetical protein
MVSKALTGMASIAGTQLKGADAAKTSETLQTPHTITDQELAYNEFKYRMFLLAAAIIAYLCYKFMIFMYHRYLAYRVVIPQITGDTSIYRCHVYLEIVNERSKALLYVVSIAAAMVNVTFCADTRVKIKGVTNTLCTTILHLEWENGYFKLFHDIKCMYPSAIHVPFFSRWTVTKMAKLPTHGRILILQDVYYSLTPLVRVRHSLNAKEQRRKKKLVQWLDQSLNPQEGEGSSSEAILTDEVGIGSVREPLKVTLEKNS